MTTVTGVKTKLKLSNTSLIECGQNRIVTRSVSWNATGMFLGMACTDRCARLWTVDPTGGTREVLVVSGHTAAVTKVRFHPSEASSVCTAAHDFSVRLWDVRDAKQRSTGKIDLVSHAVSVEWYPKDASSASSSLLTVTDRNGTVAIYDVRKLSSAGAAPSRGGRSTTATPALHSFSLRPHVPEATVFSPQGTHLLSGTTIRNEGVGEFRIFPWKDTADDSELEAKTSVYAAHCGPIYALQFSPNGKQLASGSSDSTYALWDVESMCCINSWGNRTKFICGVAFSADNKLMAVCSEDDGVDLIDASTGGYIGSVELSHRPRAGGAEEVAFHPKARYLLACARMTSPQSGSLPVAPVIVAKFTVNDASQ